MATNSCPWPQRLIGIWICGLACLIQGCGKSTTDQSTAASPATPGSSQSTAILIREAPDGYAQALRDGISVAAQEFEIPLEWMSTTGDDSTRQVELLRKAIDERFRAICISPIDPKSIVESLEAATKAGIPVVALEQAMSSKIPLVSFVSTDHFHAGRIVAEHVAGELKLGKVLLLEGPADENASVRRQGLRYALETELKDLSAIDVNCGQTKIKSAVEEALQQHEQVAAIVALDAPTTAAAVKLVKDNQLDLKIYGYGAWKGVETEIVKGRLAATLLEDPYIIGYSAIMALSNHFKGGENLEFIMPEPVIVSASNVDDPTSKRLLEANSMAEQP